jgi:hypothetical protein
LPIVWSGQSLGDRDWKASRVDQDPISKRLLQSKLDLSHLCVEKAEIWTSDIDRHWRHDHDCGTFEQSYAWIVGVDLRISVEPIDHAEPVPQGCLTTRSRPTDVPSRSGWR